jgi:hypothetical protein
MRTWTLAAVLLALAGLTACKREPTFDERYAGAQKAIREKAGELDKDMAKRASENATDAAALSTDAPATKLGAI